MGLGEEVGPTANVGDGLATAEAVPHCPDREGPPDATEPECWTVLVRTPAPEPAQAVTSTETATTISHVKLATFLLARLPSIALTPGRLRLW